MDPWFHGEVICRFLDEEPERSKLILVPRGAGKTGSITAPRPVWWLARDPSDGIIIINAREERAKAMGRVSASIIANNRRFKKVFPYLTPSDKWGEAGYYLRANEDAGAADRVDAAINCYGLGGNVTGSHVGGALIVDDLINESIAKYQLQLESAEKFFIEAQNCIDPGRPQVVIGTRWHYNDFYGKILEGEITGNDGEFKCLKLGVYDKRGELIFPQRSYFDQRGRAKTVGYTKEFIEGRKTNLRSMFSALYLNEPVADEDRQFQISQVKTFNAFKDLPFELGPVSGVGVETESQGNALVSVLLKVMREQSRIVNIERLTSKKEKKEDRIRAALQGYIKDSKFWIHEALWRGAGNLGEELRNFDKGNDDCLDAASYAVRMAMETPEGNKPLVAIACDPAFTDSKKSDWSAVVAACKFRGECYILECHRFKTNDTHYTATMLLNMYDRFNSGQHFNIKSFDAAIPGFRSLGSGGQSAAANKYDDGFDCDLSMLIN